MGLMAAIGNPETYKRMEKSQSIELPHGPGIAGQESSILPSRRLTGRLASIDGWRALSILMVLGAHCYSSPIINSVFNNSVLYPALDGNLGVRFFFVISGFLITYLLLKEVEKYGQIDIKAFYVRRALRILPVYSAYLVVVAVLQFLTIVHQPLITWVGDMTFTVNFLPRGVISGHLWSLAVEEQFYFIWPLVLSWLCSQKNNRSVVIVLSVPIVTAFLFHIVGHEKAFPWIMHPLFHLHSSFLNFDSLDVGCISAFLLVNQGGRLSKALESKKHWVLTMLGISMILGPCYAGMVHLSFIDFLNEVMGKFFQATGFAILLLSSILYPARFPFLNWRMVAYIGCISYSVYIWQQIYCYPPAEYKFPDDFFFKFPGCLVAAFATAMVSYHFLELPLLKLKARLGRG
jgi:peptidoglycan/LPS O-acetylase OafA/YrhL